MYRARRSASGIPLAPFLAAALLITSTDISLAQQYPAKPIRMVTTEAGGASDIAARLIARALAASLGQFVVDNRAGILAIEAAAKAPPDGYTLLFFGGTLWLLPLMRDNVSWDPIRDFAPVSLAVSSPLILVANPALPAKSATELIALAKAKPGALNYGSAGSGSATHLAAELFKSMAGVDIVRVAYKGAGPALNALSANEVQLMFGTAGSVSPHVKAGRLNALAVTSARPSALVPGVPTIASSGLHGYESVSILGIFAPSRTPASFIEILHRQIELALSQPSLKEQFLNIGVEPVGSSPQELASTIKNEMAKMGKVIRDAGIRGE